jgi:hypothetical protein
MSKRNNKQNQQAPSKEAVIDLAALAVAKSITIRLPASLALEKINQPLMHGYLRFKVNGKRISAGQSFVALYLGKEYSFTILSITN